MASKRTCKVEKSYWRDAFGKDEVIQRIRPEHTTEYLNNPHKGTATFQRFNGDPLAENLGWNDADGVQKWNAVEAEGVRSWEDAINADCRNDRYPPTRISYCRWAWSLLEPEKGKLRFDIIDRALAVAAARGQTLQFRTQPQVGPYECPKWYWDLGAKSDPEASRPGYRVADHNDPLYIQHWGDHIRALGDRYDGHPNLESFDIAYGGGCGETGGNTNCPNARTLAQIYLDSFPGTQLLGMLGTEGCAYAARQRGHRIGWRADCFGDVHVGRFDGKEGPLPVPRHLTWNHMRDAYPVSLRECGMEDTWKTAPITFETCWTVPYWFNNGWDIDWIIEQGLKYHPSVFMPKSVYIPEQWMDKIMAFSQRLGYWLHLHQMIIPLEAKAGRKFEVSAVIDNKGVAPIYRPYRFALRFSQGKTHRVVRLKEDIRSWMPDLTSFAESFTFPAGLTRGEAKVSCGIVNAKDQPVVRLAIKATDADGWHPLTSVDVVD
ncbi:MAG: DUF4832 domain-containing protein [Phycisphaerae bacterium]